MTVSRRVLDFVFPFLVLFALQAGTAPARAQEEPQKLTPPYITVGDLEGSPGASLIVPVYYTPDPKTAIDGITVEIDFVSNNLAFQDATKGVVDPDHLEVSSSLAKGTADSKGVTHSQVKLTIGLKDKNSKRGLGEGLLAYLMFQLSAEAKPFIITLNPKIISAEDSQKRKVSNFAARNGSISVLSEDATPEMSCFFFTH